MPRKRTAEVEPPVSPPKTGGAPPGQESRATYDFVLHLRTVPAGTNACRMFGAAPGTRVFPHVIAPHDHPAMCPECLAGRAEMKRRDPGTQFEGVMVRNP